MRRQGIIIYVLLRTMHFGILVLSISKTLEAAFYEEVSLRITRRKLIGRLLFGNLIIATLAGY